MMRRMWVRAAALFCLAALTAAGGGRPAGVEFRLTYLAIHGRRQDTVHYDFNGDGRRDLLNITIDYDKTPPERWLAVHLHRGGADPSRAFHESPDHLWSVSDRASAVLFGDYLPGAGVEIGFLAEDGVYLYPWGKNGPSEEPMKLLHVPTFFRSPSPNQLPGWSGNLDFDGNGRDDLLVPLADGYRLYFQTAPGVFGKTATLEADLRPGRPRAVTSTAFAEVSEVASAHFRYTTELPRLEAVDINGDGLLDLLLIRGDTIVYFKQKSPGVFPARRPFMVTYAIPTLREEAKKDTVSVSQLRFVDLNQDGLADLVVTKIAGQVGLWESIKTSIYLHLGNGRGNFIADKRIVIDGVSINPEFVDMNLDGKLDAVTSRLRTDLMRQAVSAFVLGDIAISFEVFQFEPARNTFLTDPVYEKRILVARNDLKNLGADARPFVYIRGDHSGDGRPDMAVIDPKAKKLLIHPGRVRRTGDGPRIDFDGTPHWRIPIPRHPKGVGIRDVNGDGVHDVILYHAGQLGLALSRKR